MNDPSNQKHNNLYYIFAVDKKAHPMPHHKMEAIQKAVFARMPPKAGLPP